MGPANVWDEDLWITRGNHDISFGSRNIRLFEEFPADIVGTWTVSDLEAGITNFQIAKFDHSTFPSITLLSPTSGDIFYDRETVQTEIAESIEYFQFNDIEVTVHGIIMSMNSPDSGFELSLMKMSLRLV